MFTKVKDKKGKITFFRTQQYKTGLYVIQDDNPSLQYVNLDMTEQEFHDKIRSDKKYKVISSY